MTPPRAAPPGDGYREPVPESQTTTPRPLTRGDAAIALGIACAAMMLRLLFLFTWPDHAWPHSIWYEGDAVYWADWADALASGRVYEHGLPFRSPAVAYLLYWFGFSGGDYTWAKVAWCATSAASCGAAYLIFAAEFGRRAAVIGAALLIASFASYVQAVSLNGETPYTILLVLAVAGTWMLVRRPGPLLALGLGILHGAASLIRPEHPLIAAMLLGWMLWRWRGDCRTPRIALRRASLVVVLGATALLVCAPWSIAGAHAIDRYNRVPEVEPMFDSGPIPWTPDGRSFIGSLPAFCRADLAHFIGTLAAREGATEVTRTLAESVIRREFGYIPEPLTTFVPISSQGPLSFALANSPAATGGFTKAGLDARFEPDPPLRLAIPSHLRLYNDGYAVGLRHIFDDPGRWARLAATKLTIFFEGACQGISAENWPLGRTGVRRAVDQFTADVGAAAVAWRVTLAALFILGLTSAALRRGGTVWMLVIAAKVVVAVLFYGYARQGASIIPAFAVFFGIGADTALSAAERAFAPARRIAYAIGLLACVGVVAADMHRFLSPGRPRVTGSVRDQPSLGPGAFVSFQDIRIEPSPAHEPPRP
jgi:hypothetical protein